MKEIQLVKYPRTQHIQGSRLQPGDEDLESVPFEQIKDRYIVVEEKMDGANSAISFDHDGRLWLQSRGHFLTGGNRERHFDLFKNWGGMMAGSFVRVLGQRYIAYGEWLFAKHTIFYNRLPHYWLEFDVFDRDKEIYLTTADRKTLLGALPVVPVKVLFAGHARSYEELVAHIGKSIFIGDDWRASLESVCRDRELSFEKALSQTDSSQLMEGLYIKVEENGRVAERYKFVRASFLASVDKSESHWLARPIIPNQLAPKSDIFDMNRQRYADLV